MKKILKSLIVVIIMALMMTGCSSTSKHVKEITFDQFKEKMVNKETFAMYVGNEDCTHCVSYKPVLEKVLDDYNINIYHLDNSKLSSSEYADFKTYVNISGTPTVVFIENGDEETTLNRISGEVSREETIERFKTNGYIK